MREVFRGSYADRMAVKTIDPARPHRFVETEVGNVGTCALCASRERNSIHSADAKQRTVETR